MRLPPLCAALFIFIAAPLSHALAADPPEIVDPATVNRALHLYNIAICLDTPALIVTDLDQISKAPPEGEKFKGPPPADAETLEVLEAQERATRLTSRRVYALFQVGAMGGQAEYLSNSAHRLCLARARVTWARGDAAATIDWLEQAVGWSLVTLLDQSVNMGGPPTVTIEERSDASNAAIAAERNARVVRQSCEALGYRVNGTGSVDKLDADDFDARWLYREPKPLSTNLSPAQPISILTSLDAKSFLQYLRSCQASASLGLPVCSTLYIDNSAKFDVYDAPCQDKETLRILENRKLWAMRTYHHVKRLHDSGSTGGEMERRSLAALRMSQSHAALAWANADSIAAISWLERARQWGSLAHRCTRLAHDNNTATYKSEIDSEEAEAKVRLAASCVQNTYKNLPSGLKNNGDRPGFTNAEEQIRPVAPVNLTTPTVGDVTSCHSLLHLTNIAGCLGLPPLIGLHDRSPATTKTSRGPPSADSQMIEGLLADSDSATFIFLRAHALCQAGVSGGNDEVRAKAAARLCLSRARLAWATGQAGMAVAWLDHAVHWSAVAVDAAEAAYRVLNCLTLEYYVAAQDAQLNANLAARYVRMSCEQLQFGLHIDEKPPSLPEDAWLETYRAYSNRIRAKYSLPKAQF